MILSSLVNFVHDFRDDQFLLTSIRQAEELSMTVPTSANFGAHSNEVDPPAEKSAISR